MVAEAAVVALRMEVAEVAADSTVEAVAALTAAVVAVAITKIRPIFRMLEARSVNNGAGFSV